jgi:purine-binding chemotaxis protein CheW
VSESALDHAPSVSACLVEIAGRLFAVEIGQAREAHTFAGYTAVPLGPPQLIGMTNLRGAIIPILDLRVPLGLPARAATATVQALVVEANEVRVALAVDSVRGIESLDEGLEPADPAVGVVGLERGHLRRGDDAVPVLDVAEIVDSLGRRSPKEVDG